MWEVARLKPPAKTGGQYSRKYTQRASSGPWPHPPSTMAPGGCCSFRHQRKWIGGNVLASFCLCGSAIFLYVSIAPLAAKLNCAILYAK